MAYISFQPKDYFNTNFYTGNNTDNRAITGIGFQPDFTWIKLANATQQHELFDAVRGANKPLNSNTNAAETTETNKLKSFDSDGFTLGTSTSVNKNYYYISQNWKAGGGQGSSNTDGSINTTYTSASTTSGFSICKWTGSGANATIGHGLGVVPKMIMVKNLATTDSWNVYHESIGNNKRVFLDTSGAESTTSDAWNTTSPTTSVFSVGTNTGTNKSGDALIAYCFAEKKGFSKFGSYVGNGNFDGAFIFCGFKPKFLMTKYAFTGGTGGWLMYNASLNTVNKDQFFHHEANTDASWVDNTDRVDFLSNGFKFRDSTNSDSNTNGGTYIYMAFAEAPFVASNGTPATAR